MWQDLGLDWRLGAEWFESLLLDHDPCSNYGNWNYVAGVGTDPREGRKFNMIKQARDYDPDGEFVRLWCKELSGLKGGAAHTPWLVSPAELERAGLELGTDYPSPLVTAPEWGRHTGGGQGVKKGASSHGPPRGQKGIQAYFKPGEEGKSKKENMKPRLKGGRVQ